MTENPVLDEVLDALRTLTEDAASRGAVLYGASAKKQLTRIFPGFSERTLGFRKFIELLQIGAEQGWFALEIIDGHPRLRAANAKTDDLSPAVWLKPDLWSSFLTWESGERRWDRKRGRAIFIPTDDEGAPLWSKAPEDFVDIEPVSMGRHLEWMRQFAAEQRDDARVALESALDDETPGAFKRALANVRLQQDWNAYLRHKVGEHAASWATRNEVAFGSLVEVRAKARSGAPSRSRTDAPSVPATGKASPTAEDELRTRLHQVIDRMSLAELAAMSVPASYLIFH